MYGIVLLMALGGSAETADFGKRGCQGASSCSGVVASHGCSGVVASHGCSGVVASHGCAGGGHMSCGGGVVVAGCSSSGHGTGHRLFGGHGCSGGGLLGGRGCHGGGLFSKLRGHKNSCHGSVACHGSASCHGDAVYHGCSGGVVGCSGGVVGCSGGVVGCSGGVIIGCAGGVGCAGGTIIHEGTVPATEPAKEMPKTGDKKEDKKTALPAPATLVVELPADARLLVDDVATRSTSTVRSFVTPNLTPEATHSYTLKAEVVRDGQILSVTEHVQVRAGSETRVTFDASRFTALTVASK